MGFQFHFGGLLSEDIIALQVNVVVQ